MEPGRFGRITQAAKDMVLYPLGSQVSDMGIWQGVRLIRRDDLYIEDVFVRTSFRKRAISVTVTLRNLSSSPKDTVVRCDVLDGERKVLELPPARIAVPARSSSSVEMGSPWEDPELWWPDNPKLYLLRTSIASSQPSYLLTRFGFREFWADGPHFLLNGKRINILGAATHPWSIERAVAERTYRRLKEAGVTAMRVHVQPWGKERYDVADEVGMLLIHESAVWCESDSYKLSDDRFWENFKRHLEAQVRMHRNHPSIVIWSLQNELLLCGGERYKGCARKLGDLTRFVKGLDPTRLTMHDGDEDPDGAADVINLHYPHKYRGVPLDAHEGPIREHGVLRG